MPAVAVFMALFFASSASRAYFLPEKPAYGLPEVADFDIPAFTVNGSAPAAFLSDGPAASLSNENPAEASGAGSALLSGPGKISAPPAGLPAGAKANAGIGEGLPEGGRAPFAPALSFAGPGAFLLLDNVPGSAIGPKMKIKNSGPLDNSGWDHPSQGGGMAQKTWKLSDKESFFGNAAMNYKMPDGPVLPEERQYAFNAAGKFTTSRLAPVTIDAQAQSGYSYSNINGIGTMPIGFMLGARADNLDKNKKLTLQSTYNLNTNYTDLFYMAPVTHQVGQSLGYKLTPKLDLNGAVAYRVTECANSAPQEVYQGGLAWSPASGDSVHGNLMLTNTANGTSYQVSAGYQLKLASTANFAVDTIFQQDLMRLSHESLAFSYSWKWGKYMLSAASTISADEYPFPEQQRLGQSIMLKITRVFGIPFKGI